MTPPVSDSQNPVPEPSPEDDWGDAVQLVRDDAGGSSVLPARRQPTEKTVVTIIESEEDETTEDQETSHIPDSPLGKGKIRVREIIGRKVKRLRSEKPTVDKIARKEAAFEEAKNERWEIEDKEWSGVQTFQTKWMLGIAAGVIVLILTCLALLPMLNKGKEDGSREQLIRQEIGQHIEQRDAAMEELLVKRDEAEAIFEDYASAPVIDDVLPLLKDTREVEPLLRSVGHEAKVSKQWEVSENAVWSLHLVNEKPYAELVGEFPDFTKFDAYFGLKGDNLFLDWKATTGYCSASYEELKQGEGDASEIRGTVNPANLYTLAYPEGEYQCYQLVSPDQNHMIWCYAKVGTDVSTRLAKLFVGGGIVQQQVQPVNVTLKLVRGPNGALKNQWLIEELLHEQWIHLD